MDIAKIEMLVNTKCWEANAVRKAFWNGTEVAWSSMRYGGIVPDSITTVLKVTEIHATYAAVRDRPVELCFDLAPPCNTLAALCVGGVCRNALFDSNARNPAADGGCCPTSQLFKAAAGAGRRLAEEEDGVLGQPLL